METSFAFVDGTNVDKSTRKMMRRHVMMGKNAGKTIHRRSKRDLLLRRHAAPVTAPPPSSCSMALAAKESGAAFAITPSQYAWERVCPISLCPQVLDTFRFPVTLTRHNVEVISNFFLFVADRLYPLHLGLSLRDSKFTWLKVLMSDTAAFHCNIGLMQASNEIFLGQGDGSPEVMMYLTNSLAQVRKRLDGAHALSDSTLGLVMTLITQEQIRNQHHAAKVHMDGLKRMIDLRGGLESLENSLPVLLKACKTDIIFSLQHEEPPKFYRNRIDQVLKYLASKQLSFDRTAARKLVQHEGLDERLLDILLDIMSMSILFNGNNYGEKIDLFLFQELLISVCYRLMAFDAVENKKRCAVQDGYQIGLTLFMMSLFLQYGRRRVLNYDNMTQRLKRILESSTLGGEDEFVLWLLMTGGVWVLDDADMEWLHPKIKAHIEGMGLRSYEEVLKCVKKYPWIGKLHEEPGRTIWNCIQGK